MNNILNIMAKSRMSFHNNEMFFHSKDMMGAGGFFWPSVLIRAVVAIAVIISIVILIKKDKKNRSTRKKMDQERVSNENSGYTSALKILNERFVNGEISDEEYIAKKEILNGNIKVVKSEEPLKVEKDS